MSFFYSFDCCFKTRIELLFNVIVTRDIHFEVVERDE